MPSLNPYVETDVKKGNFEYEASVIIPCAIAPVPLTMPSGRHSHKKHAFHSTSSSWTITGTDGTTEIIGQYKDNKAVIHLQPQRTDLGMGMLGPAINHPGADASPYSLTAMTCTATPIPLQNHRRDTFYKEQCAMVIGTYRMTDFRLNTIAPGVIDQASGRKRTDTTTHCASTVWGSARILHTYPARNRRAQCQLRRRLCPGTHFLAPI